MRIENVAKFLRNGTVTDTMFILQKLADARVTDHQIWNLITQKIRPEISNFHPIWISKTLNAFNSVEYSDQTLINKLTSTFVEKAHSSDLASISIFLKFIFSQNRSIEEDQNLKFIFSRAVELLSVEDASQANHKSLMLLLSVASQNSEKLPTEFVSTLLSTISACANSMSTCDLAHAVYLTSKITLLSPIFLQNTISGWLPLLQSSLCDLSLKDLTLLANSLCRVSMPTLPFHHLLLNQITNKFSSSESLNISCYPSQKLLQMLSMSLHAFSKTDTSTKRLISSTLPSILTPLLSLQVLHAPPNHSFTYATKDLSSSKIDDDSNKLKEDAAVLELEKSLTLLANAITSMETEQVSVRHSSHHADTLPMYLIGCILAPPPLTELSLLRNFLSSPACDALSPAEKNGSVRLRIKKMCEEDGERLAAVQRHFNSTNRAPFVLNSASSTLMLYKAFAIYRAQLNKLSIPANDPLANFYLPAAKRASKWLLGCLRNHLHEMSVGDSTRLMQSILTWTVSRPVGLMRMMTTHVDSKVREHQAVKSQMMQEEVSRLLSVEKQRDTAESDFDARRNASDSGSMQVNKIEKQNKDRRRHLKSLPAPPNDIASFLDCLVNMGYSGDKSEIERIVRFVLDEFALSQTLVRNHLKLIQSDSDWDRESKESLLVSSVSAQALQLLRGDCRVGDAVKVIETVRKFAFENGGEWIDLMTELNREYLPWFAGPEKPPLNGPQSILILTSLLRLPVPSRFLSRGVGWSAVHESQIADLASLFNKAISSQLTFREVGRLAAVMMHPIFDDAAQSETHDLRMLRRLFLTSHIQQRKSLTELGLIQASAILEICVAERLVSPSYNEWNDVVKRVVEEIAESTACEITCQMEKMEKTTAEGGDAMRGRRISAHQASILLSTLVEIRRKLHLTQSDHLWMSMDEAGRLQKMILLLVDYLLFCENSRIAEIDALTAVEAALNLVSPSEQRDTKVNQLLAIKFKQPSPSRHKEGAAGARPSQHQQADALRTAELRLQVLANTSFALSPENRASLKFEESLDEVERWAFTKCHPSPQQSNHLTLDVLDTCELAKSCSQLLGIDSSRLSRILWVASRESCRRVSSSVDVRYKDLILQEVVSCLLSADSSTRMFDEDKDDLSLLNWSFAELSTLSDCWAAIHPAVQLGRDSLLMSGNHTEMQFRKSVENALKGLLQKVGE